MIAFTLKDGTTTVSNYTTISSSGLLYIALGQNEGTILVEAQEDEAKATATITVESLPLTGNPVNVLADNSKNGQRQLGVKVGDLSVTDGTWELVKTHSTTIAPTTTIDNNGLLKWTTAQTSGQIGAKFTKEDVSITIPIVFSKVKSLFHRQQQQSNLDTRNNLHLIK